jgi:hypothetical protein
MSVKRNASLERRVGQGVERRESAEAERRGARSGEEVVTESSSCSAMRRTRSSETAGACGAAESHERRWRADCGGAGGGAQRRRHGVHEASAQWRAAVRGPFRARGRWGSGNPLA